MPATIEKNLKKEILQLPANEKDKLLLRLIAKDQDLVERLHFVLIEHEATTEERRLEIKEKIAFTAAGHYPRPDGWLLKTMRGLSLAITHHVKITKDKYGDIELNLYLLTTFFDVQPSSFAVLTRDNDQICAYVAKKADSILKKLTKVESDYYIEFEEDVNRILTFIHTYGPRLYARDINLSTTWN